MSRLALVLLLPCLCATTFAETANTGQLFGFRVKGTALTTIKGSPDITPALHFLPLNKGKPTLAGLTDIFITFDNSFFYISNIDESGRMSGDFTAKLTSTGRFAIVFTKFDVTGVLGVSTKTDGTFTTPPIPFVISVISGQNQIDLLSVPDFQITYIVNHGVAKAIAAK